MRLPRYSWSVDRTCRSPTRRASKGRSTVICVSCACKAVGQPVRVFYAFDPTRSAILLVGGNKIGDKRFYKKMIPIADRLYDEHIAQLKREGLIP